MENIMSTYFLEQDVVQTNIWKLADLVIFYSLLK